MKRLLMNPIIVADLLKLLLASSIIGFLKALKSLGVLSVALETSSMVMSLAA
jgi:hypothetical protein